MYLPFCLAPPTRPQQFRSREELKRYLQLVSIRLILLECDLSRSRSTNIMLSSVDHVSDVQWSRDPIILMINNSFISSI